MQRRYGIIAGIAILAAVAGAQDGSKEQADSKLVQQKLMMEKMVQLMDGAKVLGPTGAVMSSPVKGAPYSGVEVTENTQVLADGTRIHNQNQVNVYRDSEGRVRRETPAGVSIFDPVAHASFSLDPKTQTARKLPLGTSFFTFTGKNGNEESAATYSYRVSASGAELKARDEKVAMAKADLAKALGETKSMAVAVDAGASTGITLSTQAGGWARFEPGAATATVGPVEHLETQMIEGVNARGTRSTQTLEAGAIGNDRPIQVVSERWYSPELQTVMMTRHNDPRTGEETFKLTNVNRSEPSPVLFQVPPDYKLVEDGPTVFHKRDE